MIYAIGGNGTGNPEQQFTKCIGFPVAGTREKSRYYFARFTQPTRHRVHQTLRVSPLMAAGVTSRTGK
jgi:hypothetical protein